MKQEINNPKSKNQFREVTRFGFTGHLSNGLRIINSKLYFLTIKYSGLFCSKFPHHSQYLPQNFTIIRLE